MRIAIAGAHGQVARLLEKSLVDSGHEVVGIVRKDEQADELRSTGVEPAVLSLEEASVAQAADVVRGCDAVVFAAGSGGKGGHARTWGVDLLGAVLMIDAAEEAGVRRFVMLSSVGSDTPSQADPDFQVYLYAKGGADADLRTRDLDWTVVRPGPLTDDAPTGRIAVDPENERASVTRGDVAAVLEAVLLDDSTVARTFVVTNGDTPTEEAVASVASA